MSTCSNYVLQQDIEQLYIFRLNFGHSRVEDSQN
jgi:hypothetical protein